MGLSPTDWYGWRGQVKATHHEYTEPQEQPRSVKLVGRISLYTDLCYMVGTCVW
ncbi:hypothetical protein Tchar_02598 [Tepidimonas charontis]|uniref:Uncharacterized protein n=1 Tax=Tepidimonas charontis TaxID=2267262 RepID=A0A554X0B4_9BURK|nr:hypothetical protein Tchar_02598 [Tepidimonas charontis]